MAKLGQQKIEQLIAEMGHYDPDNMEMAAKRLSELILAGDIVLVANSKDADSIREAFMKQISSENDTVQSEAIKYLADIVPKLPSDQVELIFEKILEHITNINEAEKKRERYGACAATVIHQAAEEYGSKLMNLFTRSVRELLQFKDKKTEIEIILINIITEFLRKWPNVAANLTYDRKGLLIYLMKNIQVKTKLDIIKKSETCIGKLALILDRDHINIALNDDNWGLLRFIVRSHTKPSVESLKHARNGLLCLAQMIKTHNIELRYWVKETAHMLLAIINQFKSHQDIDNIEIICDILDASLTALAYLIRTFSRQLREQLQEKNNPYSSFLKELIDFNVEGMMTYAGQEMQVEDAGEEDMEYYEEAEVDEKCWKVRRSALYYISFLARHDHHFLKSLSGGDLISDLGAKLIEEHNMVSEMAFSTFNELIELISIDRALTTDQQEEDELNLLRVKSSARDIADLLIQQIQSRIKIILNNSKFNDQLKIQASKILLRIIQIYKQNLITNEEKTFGLVNFLNGELKKIGITECKVNLLQSLRQLVADNYPFVLYEPVLSYLLETISRQNNIKIQNICLLSIKKFLDLFAQDLSKSPLLPRVVELIKGKVKELDSDKLIKQASCKCLAVLFQRYHLENTDYVFFFDSLTQKLKIQVEKLYLIETLNHVEKKGVLAQPARQSLEGVIRQVAESLGSNNYQLNHKAIETVDRLLTVLEQGVSSKLLEYLLQKSKIILGEGKIPSFLKHVATVHPKLLKPYAQMIVKSTESYYVAVLLNEKVIDISSCLKIFKGLDQDKAKKISQTLGAIKFDQKMIQKEIDQSSWGKVMVGALGYVGTEVTLPSLFGYLKTFQSDEAKSDVCSAIGNILSRNPDQLLPKFLEAANVSPDIYTNIYIIKEMLVYRHEPFGYLENLIEWLLQKSEGKFEAESNYYITSECVGKLAFLHSQAAKKVISNQKAVSANRRLVVASSLRFGLDTNGNAASFDEECLEEYIQAIVQLITDDVVGVREGATKSMISVGQCYVKGAKREATNKQFWQAVIQNCRINEKLIVVIDYGLCKQVRDDGKNLRLQSFNLLQVLAKKVHLESQLIEELMEVSLFKINEQTSNDIILKRINLLKTLCSIEFAPFIRLQNEFIAKVNPKDGLLKKYEKGVQEEKTEVYLRGILKEISEIGQLAREENVEGVGALVVDLKNNPLFSTLLDELEHKK